MPTTPALKVAAVWLLALLLLAAGFVTAVTVLNGRLYSPEHQVGLYLDALRDGDGAAALGLLNATVPEDANPALLDGEALRSAGAPLEDVQVGDARVTGDDHVEVPVTYLLAGSEHTTIFPLRRIDREWGFFDVWQFEESVLPTTEVSVVNSVGATVNGIAVGLPGGTVSLATFYPTVVEAEYADEYFAAPAQQASVLSRDSPPSPLVLATEATPQLTQAAEDQLRAFLDDCADQTVFQPTNCPFNYPTDERLAGSIDWSIEEYPTASITAVDGGWSLAPLQGVARIDTELQDYFSGAIRSVSEHVPFEFGADLLVTDDAVTITPVVRY